MYNFYTKSKANIIHKIGESNSKYLSDFCNFGIWYFVAAFVGLVTTILLNKNLEPVELGKYSYFRSIVELAINIVTINIYSCYLRFNIEGVSKSLWTLSKKITIFAVIVISILLLLLTKSYISVFFALLIVFNERTYMARSMMDIKSVNILRIVSVITTLSFVALLCLMNIPLKNDYVFGAYGIGYIFSFYLYRKKYVFVQDIDVLKYKTILKFTLPGLGIIIVDWLLNLSGQAFLKEFSGYEEVAKLAIAQRAVSVIKLFSGLFLMFYPVVYYREINKKNAKSINVIRLLMITIMLSICAVSFVFSESFYRVLGANCYLEYVGLFRILVISQALSTITSFYASFLSFVLKTYWALIISAIGALVNLVAIYAFLPVYGIYVVPFSILISNIIMSAFYFFVSYLPERKYLYSK